MLTAALVVTAPPLSVALAVTATVGVQLALYGLVVLLPIRVVPW